MSGISALKTVSYTSRARLDLRDEELRQIHNQARHLNALDGITGLLAFDGARFLQIVEGSEEAVDDLIGRLRRDARHTAFEVRDERVVGARSFPEWNMEMVQVSAGYLNARSEIASLLPRGTCLQVRELALRMSDELSRGA
jgi:hypothetical protein